jgi:hypothetical protein
VKDLSPEAMSREVIAAVLISNAECGDKDASRSLAGFAATLLRAGTELPECLHSWLCENLERIKAGKAPAFAPLTRNARGRGRMTGGEQWEIAEHFAQARQMGMTVEAAAQAVEELFGVSERTVRKVWKAREDRYPPSMGGTGPEPVPVQSLRLPIGKPGKK